MLQFQQQSNMHCSYLPCSKVNEFAYCFQLLVVYTEIFYELSISRVTHQLPRRSRLRLHTNVGSYGGLAFALPVGKQGNHFGDALGADIGATFGAVNPAQVFFAVKSGQTGKKIIGVRVGVERRHDVGRKVVVLGTFEI